MQATTDVICGGEKYSPAGWVCLFVCVPCLMHYRVVVVSRSHWNHSVLLCGRDFTGFLCDCMCFPEGTASPLRLSLSLRGGNSIWLLKCCGQSMSALQPLNDHPVRSDWSMLWRGSVRNLSALPDLSVEDLACLAGSYPIWNSRRIVEADTKNPANQLLSLRVTVWLLLLFVFFCTYQLICF